MCLCSLYLTQSSVMPNSCNAPESWIKSWFELWTKTWTIWLSFLPKLIIINTSKETIQAVFSQSGQNIFLVFLLFLFNLLWPYSKHSFFPSRFTPLCQQDECKEIDFFPHIWRIVFATSFHFNGFVKGFKIDKVQIFWERPQNFEYLNLMSRSGYLIEIMFYKIFWKIAAKNNRKYRIYYLSTGNYFSLSLPESQI